MECVYPETFAFHLDRVTTVNTTNTKRCTKVFLFQIDPGDNTVLVFLRGRLFLNNQGNFSLCWSAQLRFCLLYSVPTDTAVYQDAKILPLRYMHSRNKLKFLPGLWPPCAGQAKPHVLALGMFLFLILFVSFLQIPPSLPSSLSPSLPLALSPSVDFCLSASISFYLHLSPSISIYLSLPFYNVDVFSKLFHQFLSLFLSLHPIPNLLSHCLHLSDNLVLAIPSPLGTSSSLSVIALNITHR